MLISSCLSVCLSALHPSFRHNGTTRLPLKGFSRNVIFDYFARIYREKSSFILNLTRIRGTLREHLWHLWSHLPQVILEWEIIQRQIIQKIKTHIAFWIIFFSENLKVYEIMWKTVVEPDRPQMTLWDAWALNAGQLRQEHRHTLTLFGTYCFYMTTKVMRRLLIITLYVHCFLCIASLRFTFLIHRSQKRICRH